MMRVCPKRDMLCPYGMDCPYTIDRYHCAEELPIQKLPSPPFDQVDEFEHDNGIEANLQERRDRIGK